MNLRRGTAFGSHVKLPASIKMPNWDHRLQVDESSSLFEVCTLLIYFRELLGMSLRVS